MLEIKDKNYSSRKSAFLILASVILFPMNSYAGWVEVKGWAYDHKQASQQKSKVESIMKGNKSSDPNANIDMQFIGIVDKFNNRGVIKVEVQPYIYVQETNTTLPGPLANSGWQSASNDWSVTASYSMPYNGLATSYTAGWWSENGVTLIHPSVQSGLYGTYNIGWGSSFLSFGYGDQTQ